jgi:hypothetical protein
MLKNKKHRKNKKSWNSYRRWFLENITDEVWFNIDSSMPFNRDDYYNFPLVRDYSGWFMGDKK